MLILGIDTAGRQGSVALARGGAAEFRCLEVVRLAGGSYSARLVPAISDLLVRHGLVKTMVEALAVVAGPGSFTGLRVGLSTAKALAEVMQIPVAAVSSLETVAWAAGASEPLVAALDAGRGQVFYGSYRPEGGRMVLQGEWLSTPDEALPLLRGQEARLVTPDEALAEALQKCGLPVQVVEAPHAGLVARIGLGKISRGEASEPEVLDANYIRRSDAELFSLPKLSS